MISLLHALLQREVEGRQRSMAGLLLATALVESATSMGRVTTSGNARGLLQEQAEVGAVPGQHEHPVGLPVCGAGECGGIKADRQAVDRFRQAAIGLEGRCQFRAEGQADRGSPIATVAPVAQIMTA